MSNPELIVNGIFIILISGYLFWMLGLIRALGSDAPYVPMDQAVVARLVALAKAQPGDVWIDLGSGDGRVLITACQMYPGITAIGIERIGSLRWLARFKAWRYGVGARITFTRADFFTTNLSTANILSFYLLPKTNRRLYEKIKTEAAPGTKLLYHRFAIPELKVEEQDEAHKIYLSRA